MSADLIDVGTLFAGIFLGFVTLGFIDARVTTRHPEEKQRLGAPFLFSSGLIASLRHESQWARFVLYQHFARHDPVLSGLCLTHIGLWAVVITLLLGLWSPSALAV